MRSVIVSIVLIHFVFGSRFAEGQIRSQSIISRSGDIAGDGPTDCPALSGDGRFTIYESSASNLVPGDTNGRSDLFLYDRTNGTVRLLTESAQGEGQGGGDQLATCSSAISRDGSTVVYATAGAGLVPGADTNVYRIYRIPVNGGGIELLTPGPLTQGAFFPTVNEDGSKIVFVSDDLSLDPQANGLSQVYLIDTATSERRMISVAADGSAGNGTSIRPIISHDGKWVVYPSTATNLDRAAVLSGESRFQVFLLNLETGAHTLVSRNPAGSSGDGDSYGAYLSADGSVVVFFTEAVNLLPEDVDRRADILLYQREQGTLERVSISSEGKRIPGYHELLGNSLSADGNLVMFRALIGSGDRSRVEVYVRDRKNGRTYLGSFSSSCSTDARGGDSHSGSVAPDQPSLAFVVGKNSSGPPLQLALVDLDVLQTIAEAPETLDRIDADICRGNVTLAMTPYSVSDPAEVLPGDISSLVEKGKLVLYETQIRSPKLNGVRRVVSKRNLITVSDLAPGTYTTRYRVQVRMPSGVTRSPLSKATRFRVGGIAQ